MADPGFLVGGCGPVGGVDLQHRYFSPKMCAKMKGLGPIGGMDPLRGMDLQCGHFSLKMCAKTKELGPVEGACARHTPLDPSMEGFSIFGRFRSSLNLCSLYKDISFKVL